MNFNLIKFECLDSTNKYVKENWRNLQNGDVIFAEKQSNGYGRRGRRWLDDDNKNLYCSIFFKEERSYLSHSLTMLMSLSIIEFLIKVFPKFSKDFIYKWPNDIYIRNKKIAGILTEGLRKKEKNIFSCIGIGMNINSSKKFFKNIKQEASSLREELGGKFNKLVILSNILYTFNKNLKIFKRGNKLLLKEKLKKFSQLINQKININNSQRSFIASFVDFDLNGYMIAEYNGYRKKYSSNYSIRKI